MELHDYSYDSRRWTSKLLVRLLASAGMTATLENEEQHPSFRSPSATVIDPDDAAIFGTAPTPSVESRASELASLKRFSSTMPQTEADLESNVRAIFSEWNPDHWTDDRIEALKNS